MGIVLPDGNLNNPSLSWLRRWAETKARLIAVVSLPEETFRSADATVKASLVFLRRFTEADAMAWEDAWFKAHSETRRGRTTRSGLCSVPNTVPESRPQTQKYLREFFAKWRASECAANCRS